MSAGDLSHCSLFDLFRMEADAQTQVLTSALLALERQPIAADQLELCMRAAHSLKGAARIVGLAAGVRVAHAMEDGFVAAQQGHITLSQADIDTLLGATDLLTRIAQTPEDDLGRWEQEASGLDQCVSQLERMLDPSPAPAPSVEAPAPQPVTGVEPPAVSDVEPPVPTVALAPPPAPASPDRPVPSHAPTAAMPAPESSDRVLRVTADNLNRLLGLASESLVESRWVKPFADSLLRLKRMHQESCRALDGLRHALSGAPLDDRVTLALAHAVHTADETRRYLAQRIEEIELFDRRSLHLSHRLYEEALACRMRPFADGVQGFPRLVRDVAHSLGKRVRLEIVGETTQVDRDVLAKLDAPLGHLLRNAIDHGIEAPEARLAAGKPGEGVIRLEARHSAGALHVSIADDGAGVNLEKIREKVIARQLLNRDAVAKLADAELLEFLFLPGFTMKTTVTEISGRGVGLDVVQTMVKELRGVVRITTEPGRGTRFVLQLPVTLSVVRTLLAEVGGEPYAFPLSCIVRTLRLSKNTIEHLEGRQHFDFAGARIGLVTAHQVLGVDESAAPPDEVPVIVVGDQHRAYGLVIDRFLGERELVVQRLDPQLGKIKDIAAGALMEDGSPVLIVDPEDLIRSMDRLAHDGRLSRITDQAAAAPRKRKRVLVVDDSLTVRELERKLLASRGYDVEVAVDGMDGWNAARMGDFDLVVTDIDMPRMDGIELVKLINGDARLKSRPVMIVSYKDRDEDRRRGLEAGAAYYLTKGSFHDDTLVQAVVDLIGEAAA
jgi:two-component system, chemotaxis family, sensor histidine kinase and response regulator WspE